MHAKSLLRHSLIIYTTAVFLLSIGAWGIALYRYKVLRESAAASTLTSLPDNRFTDLTSILPEASHPVGNGARIEKGPPIFNLAAPAIAPYWLLSQFGKNAVSFYLCLLLLAAILACVLMYRPLLTAVNNQATVLLFLTVSVVTSYPLLFEMDRANIEGVIFILLIAGTALLTAGNRTLAGVCFALAGSIKPFPLVLFVPFLYQRWFREFAIGCGIWVIANIAAFSFFGPTIRSCWLAYMGGLQDYTNYIVTGYRPYDMNFDHSVFAVIRQIGRVVLNSGAKASAELYLPYLTFAAVFITLIIWRSRLMPLTNQLIICFVLMVLAPPANYDYTLIALYPAFGIFLLSLTRPSTVTPPSWVLSSIFGCFAIVFTPQSFLLIADTGIGGQVKAVFLLAILILSLKFSLPPAFNRVLFTRNQKA